jgi:hypothetical protein
MIGISNTGELICKMALLHTCGESQDLDNVRQFEILFYLGEIKLFNISPICIVITDYGFSHKSNTVVKMASIQCRFICCRKPVPAETDFRHFHKVQKKST